MRKQKNKQILAKVLIVVFIINAITIFNFAPIAKGDSNKIEILTPVDGSLIDHPDQGYYPATFGFEHEVIGTIGTNIDFVDYVNEENKIEVVNEFNGHKKVLRVEKDGLMIHNFVSGIHKGTFEYWFTGWGAKEQRQYLISDEGFSIQFRCDQNPDTDGLPYFQYYDGTEWINLKKIVDYQWYHIRFDFDYTSDKCSIYIDLECVASNVPMLTDGTELYRFAIHVVEWG